MRTLLAAALLAAVLPLSTPLADEPKRIELTVGETKELGGFRPLCDDPTVAWFVDAGVLKGLKAGETICSVSMGSPLGLRLVYRVVVTAAKEPAPKAGARR